MTANQAKKLTRSVLEKNYTKYNRPELIHPDPLEFIFNYDTPEDREIIGLLASSLAYGRVAQILKSVSRVLEKMKSPRDFVESATDRRLKKAFSGFKHRFTTDDEIAALVSAIGKAIKNHNSLENLFLDGYSQTDETVFPALERFSHRLLSYAKVEKSSLVPNPSLGSACKRMNLYLRWMVRKDDVDPGGWSGVSKSKLIVPLDTHMHGIGLKYGLTSRKNADMRAAMEITSAFARHCPNDPVKYDFALTRPGIRGED